MAILIRDEHFESKIATEKRNRRQKSMSKTLTQLAEERLVEIQTGQFISPVRIEGTKPGDESKSTEPASAA